MVSPMRLYVEQEHLEKAQHYVAVLFSRGVEVSIEVAEKLNARFFRFHPELGLFADAYWLLFFSIGMKM